MHTSVSLSWLRRTGQSTEALWDLWRARKLHTGSRHPNPITGRLGFRVVLCSEASWIRSGSLQNGGDLTFSSSTLKSGGHQFRSMSLAPAWAKKKNTGARHEMQTPCMRLTCSEMTERRVEKEKRLRKREKKPEVKIPKAQNVWVFRCFQDCGMSESVVRWRNCSVGGPSAQFN